MKPRIEPFETPAPGSKKNGPAKQCQSVLAARGVSLPPSGVLFWKSLASLHKEIGEQAAKVPDMPYTVSTDTTSYTFDGSPRPWTE
eukprot:1251875-Prymnesium_polylepis.1